MISLKKTHCILFGVKGIMWLNSIKSTFDFIIVTTYLRSVLFGHKI
jgi:hypothetical protein